MRRMRRKRKEIKVESKSFESSPGNLCLCCTKEERKEISIHFFLLLNSGVFTLKILLSTLKLCILPSLTLKSSCQSVRKRRYNKKRGNRIQRYDLNVPRRISSTQTR
jgi:hypothetical protein